MPIKSNSGGFDQMEESGSMNAKTEKSFLLVIILILAIIILVSTLKDVIPLG